jgi:hypothetical protein
MLKFGFLDSYNLLLLPKLGKYRIIQQKLRNFVIFDIFDIINNKHR